MTAEQILSDYRYLLSDLEGRIGGLLKDVGELTPEEAAKLPNQSIGLIVVGSPGPEHPGLTAYLSIKTIPTEPPFASAFLEEPKDTQQALLEALISSAIVADANPLLVGSSLGLTSLLIAWGEMVKRDTLAAAAVKEERK